MSVGAISLALAVSTAAPTPIDLASVASQDIQLARQEPATSDVVSPEPTRVPAPAPAEPEPVSVPAAQAADPAASRQTGAPNDKPQGQDIVVTAREDIPGDPLANINVKSFEVIQGVDQALIGPISMGYKSIAPKPVRLGLRNFLRNLEEPVIALNYLLQLKPGRALKSVGRFAVNSTFGVAGLVDVAKDKPFNAPYTPNGFANTFACYGIGPGPYFFLPLVGPTTLRDVIGVGMDRAAIPLAVGEPFDRPYYAIPANVIDSLNDRIDVDDQLRKTREEAGDPYAATRDLYLKQRKSEIAAICPRKGDVVDPTLPSRPGKGRD